MTFETITGFILVSVLLAFAPGPDNIFVLIQSASRGKSAGILVSLGLCTGLIVHTAAVALGIAVIFQTSKIAFTVLKCLGAAYLIYLAWIIIHAENIKLDTGKTENFISRRKLYFRGIIMNITNPKVAIFFLAFLPQFTNPAAGYISLQIIFLGLLFILVTILVFGSISFLAGTIGYYLTRSEKIQKTMNWLAGTVFVILALKLAVAEV